MPLSVRSAMFGIDVMILFLYRFRGNTPLIWASFNGLTDVCGMLVQNGADVNAKNKQ